MKRLRLLFTLPLLLACSLAGANSFEWLMKENEAPPGVVIEIIGSDRQQLRTLLPEIAEEIRTLRDRFPGLPVAIVSHGPEQFLTTTANANQSPETHRLLQSLVSDEAVNFHVWRSASTAHRPASCSRRSSMDWVFPGAWPSSPTMS